MWNAEARKTLPVSTPWRDGGAVDVAIGEIVRRLRVQEDLFSRAWRRRGGLAIFLTTPALHLIGSHMRQCSFTGCQFPKGAPAAQRWL